MVKGIEYIAVNLYMAEAHTVFRQSWMLESDLKENFKFGMVFIHGYKFKVWMKSSVAEWNKSDWAQQDEEYPYARQYVIDEYVQDAIDEGYDEEYCESYRDYLESRKDGSNPLGIQWK